jgi:ketosteroid isomerase-like protein
MSEEEIRDLARRFFDAYENRRVHDVAKIYAPDCVIWNNVFNSEMTGAENVGKLPEGYLRQRRRVYNDRIVNIFKDGFVIQYTLNGVSLKGHSGGLWVCIVAACRDGQISRIDEYLDSGKFPAWRGEPTAA